MIDHRDQAAVGRGAPRRRGPASAGEHRVDRRVGRWRSPPGDQGRGRRLLDHRSRFTRGGTRLGGQVAESCRCAQEVREIGYDPESWGPDRDRAWTSPRRASACPTTRSRSVRWRSGARSSSSR